MNLYWIIIFSIAAVYGILSIFLPEIFRQKRLSQRPDITFDEIYSQSFQDAGFSKALLHGIWSEVAQKLRVPESKLRPSDRFDKELGSAFFPHVELNAELSRNMRMRLQPLPKKDWPKEIITLREYVILSAQLLVHRKLQPL